MKGQMSLFEGTFIKDADCTKDTPVVKGKPDVPIYGQGIGIRPAVPGRQDSDHFKRIYLEELLPLEDVGRVFQKADSLDKEIADQRITIDDLLEMLRDEYGLELATSNTGVKLIRRN